MKDRRVSKTLTAIQNGFFEMIKEKSIEKITIADICRKANIDRSTFYYHYEDYPSFLDALEEQVISDYLSCLDAYEYDTNTDEMLRLTTKYVQENPEAFRLFFRKDTDRSSLQKIKDILREKAIPVWQKSSNSSLKELNMVFTYMINGCFALFEQYCENPEDEASFMETVDQVVKYGVYYFAYTK